MGTSRKILMVHLYSNGDCLYATAIARQIKNDFPGCHLTWAIGSFCKSIILENPFVDEILEVKNVAKNDVAALRKLKRDCAAMKLAGQYDEVFFTHNGDTNQAYYDGCIRSSVLRAYQHPITVPLTPVLRLTENEKANAAAFAERHSLDKYAQVILFEYAPQSGQSNMSQQGAVSIAEQIVSKGSFSIILSSANKVNHPNKAIIDGSELSLRETAALTHYCSFLLGSSSGITWLSTTDAAKQLPMVQLLNPDAVWSNPISRDFERFGFSIGSLIEITEYSEERVVACVIAAIDNFSLAKQTFNQPVPLHFRSTRNIVYNLLCYLEFKAIATHIKVNREVYGNNISFYKEVLMGFLIFPFRLIKNKFTKRKKHSTIAI